MMHGTMTLKFREANVGLAVDGCGQGGGGIDGGCGGGPLLAEVVEAAYLSIIGCKDTNYGCCEIRVLRKSLNETKRNRGIIGWTELRNE